MARHNHSRVVFFPGQTVRFLGRAFKLISVTSPQKRATAYVDDSAIIVRLPLECTHHGHLFSTLVRRCLSRLAHPIIHARIHELNERYFHEPVNRLFIRDNEHSFGSCSPRHNISIAFRALFLPPAVLDYLLLHELTHLKVRNHSKQFWNIISHAMPEYREKMSWLGEYGHDAWKKSIT